MANVQITIRADGEGVDPAWTVLRSEDESDETAQEILGNAIARRFSTNPGTFFTNPAYGLNLEDWVGKPVTVETIGRLPIAMRAQAEDDERVLQARAEVVSVTGQGTPDARISVKIYIVPRIGEPFDRTFVLSKDKVSLVKGTS